jgi:O-antigen/teichoic acid export membrane protein
LNQAAGLDRLRALGGARFALFRASGWAIAEYVAYPVMMLTAMPLYLWALGTVQYGQWMLLLTVTGFGGLAGLGMGPTATRLVAAARGRGDTAQALEAARACLALTLAGALPLSAAILALGLTWGDEIFAKVGSPREIFLIAAFGALLLFLEQLDGVYAGILRGVERFDLSARLEIAAKMIQVICTALIAWLTRDIFAVFLAGTVITTARCWAKMRAAQRQLSVSWLSPHWEPHGMRAAFEFGKWIWLQSTGSLMFAVVDRALVGSLLGAEALARYGIGLQLAQQIQTIPAAGAQVLFPAIARRQEANQDWGRLAVKATLAVAALGLVGTIALLLIGDWLLSIWVGQTLAEQVSPVLPWLAVGYGLLALSAGPHHVLMGAGRARLVATVTIIAGLAAASLVPWSITEWGLSGAPMGRLAYALIGLVLIVAMIRAVRQGAWSERGKHRPGT